MWNYFIFYFTFATKSEMINISVNFSEIMLIVRIKLILVFNSKIWGKIISPKKTVKNQVSDWRVFLGFKGWKHCLSSLPSSLQSALYVSTQTSQKRKLPWMKEAHQSEGAVKVGGNVVIISTGHSTRIHTLSTFLVMEICTTTVTILHLGTSVVLVSR